MNEHLYNILLVEDVEAHAELVRRAFPSFNRKFRLTVAGSLREARRCLAESTHHLIISELFLPDGKGLEFLPDGEKPGIPMVLMTSHGDEHLAVEAMKAGALDYVVKSEATLADMPHIAAHALREWNQIMKRREAEEALTRSKEFLETVLDSMNEEVSIIDVHNFKITACNASFLKEYGPDKEQIHGRYCYEITHHRSNPCTPPNDQCPLMETMKTGGFSSFEHIHYDRDGNKIYVEVSSSPIRDKHGEITHVVHISRNVTERTLMQMEKEIISHNLEERVKELDCLYGISALVDREGASMEDVLKESVNLLPLSWQYPDIACARIILEGCEVRTVNFRETEWKQTADIVLHGNRIGMVEVCYLEERPEMYDGPFMEKERNLINAAAKEFGRIIRREQADNQLKHQAFYDQLTNLPNRELFSKHLMGSRERKKWNINYMFAVLFVDLDRFKVINDSLGHIVGDKLLFLVARRLEKCVRSNDLIARFGGDEFVILLDDIKDERDSIRIANRIQKELSQPFKTGDLEMFTTASIGIAMSSADYVDEEDILRDADAAMSLAKTRGKARYEIFNAEMHSKAMQLLQLEADLRHAVKYNEFRVYYQPLVSFKDSRIIGAEALIRWQHPRRGLIPPSEFISLAEETGLILTIGEWIFRAACVQRRIWMDAGYGPMQMSVNFSSRQFQQHDIVEMIKKVLQETGMPARFLNIEITESMAMANDTIPLLNELGSIGVQISIDDFGTGFSSLGALKRLPINTIKIDRSFIRNISTDIDADAIVKAVIAMGHSLRMKITAEGVETEEQFEFLKLLQCETMQGYLCSPPVPENEFAELLLNGWRPSPEKAHENMKYISA